MTTAAFLLAWIIAAALTLFAGVVLLAAIAIFYTIEDDRRLMERVAAGGRPEAGGQGRNHGDEAEGPVSSHIHEGRTS